MTHLKLKKKLSLDNKVRIYKCDAIENYYSMLLYI